MIFGRRKQARQRSHQQSPQRSPQYLARQAEIERLITAEPAPVLVDPDSLYHSVGQPVLQALDKTDFPTLDAHYAAMNDSEVRIVALELMTDRLRQYRRHRAHDLFERAVQHGSALGLMIASALAAEFAFHARGSGTADTVTSAGRDGFEFWNQRALDLMDRAGEISGNDPFAYIMGHSATINHDDAGMAHAKKWRAIDPWNAMGWAALIVQVDARWSGDWEALPRLATFLAENAPDGHPVLTEVVSALNQHWFTLRSFGELASEDATAEAWGHSAAINAVGNAYVRFSNAYQEGIRSIRHWDRFAFGLSQVGLHEEALDVMRRQRGQFFPIWDARYADPVVTYAWCREKAFQASFRRAHPLPEDAHDDVEWGPKGPPHLPQ